MELVAPSRMHVIRFGIYELDVERGELRKYGTKIRLEGQPLEVLCVLLERPDEVITRETLRERLWPKDTYVDFESSINAAVKRLRQVLDDSAETPRYIETIPRRGYRFICPVQKNGSSGEGVEAAPDGRGSRTKRTWLVALAPMVLLAVVGAAVGLRARAGRNGAHEADPIRSLAVLPLQNLSGDASQEYLADGITDDLTTDLARISSLRVISRTSAMRYRHSSASLPQIARELKVDAVVEGSVARVGDRLRIRAQLIRAATDQHIWADSYESSIRDVLSVQGEIARAIAQQVQAKLTPPEQQRLGSRARVDPEVYQLYLQGRFEANKRTPEHMKLAAQFFQEAVAKDPRFALGYSGLADVYNLLASTTVMSPDMVNPAAREAAAKALALDESLAEAHVSMAEFLPETEAERHFKRALELNPGYAQGHLWYGRFLAARGKVEEGIREMEIAQSLDPLAPIIAANLSEHYRAARQLEKALQEAQRTVALEPAFARGHVALGQVYETQGRYDEAVAEFQRSRELGGTNWPEFRERLQHAYDKGGYRGYYEEQLRLLQQRSREQYVSPIDLAFVHTVLGHRSEAIAWLNKACEERNRGYPFVVRYPEWDSLRSDPKFGELVRRRDAGGCAQAYDPLPPSS